VTQAERIDKNVRLFAVEKLGFQRRLKRFEATMIEATKGYFM